MEDPQESSPASRNSSKPEQAFLTGFANAFSFEPGVEESDGGVARQGVGVSEVGKVGRGRKRGAEEAGGDERTWSGERGRKKMAKIETEVHKVVDKLVAKLESLATAEVRKQLKLEERERKQQERLDEKQKRANDRAAAKAAKAAKAQEKKVKKQDRSTRSSLGSEASHPHARVHQRLTPQNSAEDTILPGASRIPPEPSPLGNGLVPDESMIDLVEAWAFLNRFGPALGLKSIPNICDLERWLSSGGDTLSQSDELSSIHAHLINILIQEVFQAAKESLRSHGNGLEKRGIMQGCPRVTEKSWQEGFRRYLVASDTAQSTASYFSKFSSSSLAQRLDVPCALSTLSPHLCIYLLCGGINSPMLTCSPMLLVPGRNAKAFNCLLNRNDAEGMAQVEKWLRGRPTSATARNMTEEDALSQSELQRGLRAIIHAKDSRSGAPGEVICYHGASCAQSARSPVQWDLHRVASLVQAGAYLGEDKWKLLLLDVRSSCEAVEMAIANGAEGLPRELKTLGLKAARAVRRVADRLENTGLRDSDGKPRDVHIGRPFMPFEGCCICWKDEDKPRILLCDNCDDEYHLYCLDPPLEEIPEGDWFCPMCVKELNQQGVDMLNNTHHLVKKNKPGNNSRMVDILGCQPQESMSFEDRLAILLKICECSLGTNKLRSHLEDSIETSKELRKEVASLQSKKAIGDKQIIAPECSIGNGGDTQDEDAACSGRRSVEDKLLELRSKIASCALRPQTLGWDRHYNRYWAFGGNQQAAVFVETSSQSCWREATKHVQSASPSPKNQSRSRRDSSKIVQNNRKHVLPGQNSSAGFQVLSPQENGFCKEPCDKNAITNPSVQRCRANKWRVYKTTDQLQNLIEFLNPCGLREGPLRTALKEHVAHSQFQDTSKEVASHEFTEDDQSRNSNASNIASMAPCEVCDIDLPNTSVSGCSHDDEGNDAQDIRRELLDMIDNLPEETFEPVRGSYLRRTKWKERIREACKPQELMSGLLSLFTMFDPSNLQPYWWMWSFPTQDPGRITSMQAVFYHLEAARGALKVKIRAKLKSRMDASVGTATQLIEAQSGVRRSNRVAQLVSNPTEWRPNPEAVISDFDSDDEQLESTIPGKCSGESDDEVMDDSGDDEEWAPTDEAVPQRNRKATDEEVAMQLHMQLNSRWTRGSIA